MLPLKRKAHKSCGAAMVEYVVILGLVSVISASALRTTGMSLKCKVYNIGDSVRGGLPTALTTSGCKATTVVADKFSRPREVRNGRGHDRGRNRGNGRG